MTKCQATPRRFDLATGVLKILSALALCSVWLWPTGSLGDNLQKPMRFWFASNGGNCSDCSWIAAEGTIEDVTPSVFEKFLHAKRAESVATGFGDYDFTGLTIALNSPGGDLGAGIKLGMMIRSLGVRTGIASTIKDNTLPDTWKTSLESDAAICASACAYAFLGGKIRYASGRFGVHQFSAQKLLQQELTRPADKPSHRLSDQEIVGLLTIFVKEMGVDTELVFLASSTSSNSIYWLSKEELARLNVENWMPTQEPWRTEPYRDGAIATVKLRPRGSGYDSRNFTLFCRNDGGSKPFMLLSQKLPSMINSDDLRQFLSFGWSLGFDTSIPSPDRRKFGPSETIWVNSDGIAYVTLPLTNADVSKFAKAKWVWVDVGSPKILDFPFDGKLSLQGAAPHIGLAMRNCIR